MTRDDLVPYRLFHWRAFAITGVISLALATSFAALAQNSQLRTQRVVSFVTGKTQSLEAKVGPVSIQSVEFNDRGRVAASLGTIVRGGASASEAQTTIRGHFVVENPSRDEWEVTFTLEFLDKAGKTIDKVTRKSSWEGEAKPFDFDHPILQYVVPSIAQVRISLEARLD